MRPSRLTQPYRTSGSRGASKVLDTMRAGRAGPGNALTAAFQRTRGKGKAKPISVPRQPPPHKRRRRRDFPNEPRITEPQRFV